MTAATEQRARSRWGLSGRQVWILYGREMRAALREKAIVINSILIPIFLYPFLLWAAFTGLTFVMGQTEGFVSRVAVLDWPKEHPGLRLKLERDEQVRLITGLKSPSNIQRQIQEGKLDALLEFQPVAASNLVLTGNFTAQITYNQSQERSAQAETRLSELLGQYRREWLHREARRLGIQPAEWQQFSVALRNTASGREMGAFILGMIAPVIFVVMVAIGCFYPAVDATAGERERNTWETLMSTAADRANIVVAKYLYVVTMGGLAGILNLSAVMLTFKPIFAPLLERAGQNIHYTVPLLAFPVAALAGLLLAGFIAAGMMIFSSFARTFREGQSLIMPFYMLILVPIVFLQTPGLQFSLPLALVPIVNVTLMVRQAVAGGLHWGLVGVTVLVSLVLIGLCLAIATFILQFEEVVTGAYSGTLLKFLRQRAFRPRAREVGA